MTRTLVAFPVTFEYLFETVLFDQPSTFENGSRSRGENFQTTDCLLSIDCSAIGNPFGRRSITGYRIPDTGWRPPRARASRAVLCIFIRRNDGWQRSRGTRFALNDRSPFSAPFYLRTHTRHLHVRIYTYVPRCSRGGDRFAREKYVISLARSQDRQLSRRNARRNSVVAKAWEKR